MRNRTFPKENEKKLKQSIRDLRSRVNRLERENKFLHNEIANLVKPIRDRKIHLDKPKLTHEEWKKDFIKRFKKEVEGKVD